MTTVSVIATKILGFVRRPSAEKGQVIRSRLQQLSGFMARFSFGPTFWAYKPDSDWVYGAHPEVRTLRKQWLHGNAINNRGDLTRLYALVLNLKQINAERIEGDFAELGVYRGNSAAVLAHFASVSSRRVYLFDTFSGFAREDLDGIDASKANRFEDTAVGYVRNVVGHHDICSYRRGVFPESVTDDVRDRRFAFVHLDCDLYAPMKAGLAFFYPRLSPGGMIFVHDYSSGYWQGAKAALDEFCSIEKIAPVLLPDKSGTAVLRKAL